MAPRRSLGVLPKSSQKELLAQKKEFLQRIASDGSNFRTTPEERAQFKAAYFYQHPIEPGGTEAAWQRNVSAMDRLKENSPELEHMAIEDMVALRAWTITPDYEIVQDILENRQTATAHGLAYAKSILSALHSLPESYSYRGRVFTGEGKSSTWVNERYKEGEIATNLRFFATSEEKESAWQGKSVEWETESLHGKRISDFSFHQGEQEVLFPPGTQFKIDKIVKQACNPKIKIYQSEVEPGQKG